MTLFAIFLNKFDIENGGWDWVEWEIIYWFLQNRISIMLLHHIINSSDMNGSLCPGKGANNTLLPPPLVTSPAADFYSRIRHAGPKQCRREVDVVVVGNIRLAFWQRCGSSRRSNRLEYNISTMMWRWRSARVIVSADDMRFTEVLQRWTPPLGSTRGGQSHSKIAGMRWLESYKLTEKDPDASAAHKVAEHVSVRNHVVHRHKILCLWPWSVGSSFRESVKDGWDWKKMALLSTLIRKSVNDLRRERKCWWFLDW